MEHAKYELIGRGQNGWHAKAPGVSSSGGTLARYLEHAADGALVYDAEDADREAFVSFVISGPMSDVSLAPYDCDRFSDADRESARHMLPALGGAFKTLAAAGLNRDFRGLDSVGRDLYVALLREKVPGVRVGRVVDGAVVWEDGGTDG